MMKNAWMFEDALTPAMVDQTGRHNPSATFNLCYPASHCPQCQHSIAWFDNIPILSYLGLRGKCRHCLQNISFRYPLVESLTAFLSVLIAIRFGWNPATAAGLLLLWILIAVTFIDIDHTLIPDNLTLPGIWLGLFINVFDVFQNASSAILGAIGGYLILWSVYWIFKWITQKEGLGYGDFKLLAMLGAWLGWQMLPLIVLISSFMGAVFGISWIFFKQKDKNTPIPFGPFLAIAGFIALLWGSYLNRFYIQMMNL